MSWATRLHQFWVAPVSGDDERDRALRLLNAILLSLLVTLTVLSIVLILTSRPLPLRMSLIGLVVVVVAKWVLENGRPRLAGWLLCLLLWGVVASSSYLFSGVRDEITFGFALIIGMAALLLGRQGVAVFGGGTVLALALIYWAEQQGRIGLPLTPAANPVDLIVIEALALFFTFIIHYAVQAIRRGREQARENAAALRVSNQELHNEIREREETEQELAAINAELDQFAYIISHDLKAPLRAITNLSTWIEEDMAAGQMDGVAEHLILMRQRVAHMRRLIDGVLAYSRAGREMSSPQMVAVGPLVAEVVTLLQPPPGLTINVATGMPTLWAERVKLEQVFTNLIGNAIKYQDKENGRIEITSRELEDGVEFTVSDDGPGIDPAHHQKIFEIFQTLQAPGDMESSGIGLAVVKKIIEERGGAIQVTSQVGEGAAFCFTWPRSTAVAGTP